jgi:hypothetical protein
MEFAFDLGLGGWTLLVAGALVFGAILQFIGTAETGWEWLVDGIAAFAGAVVASEFVIAWQAFAPVWDGVALIPALIGGLVAGLVVEFVTRRVTGGTYSGRPTLA